MLIYIYIYIYLFLFLCCSYFHHVLGHCLWYFGISLMSFRWFFRFWTSFDDFGRIWSRFQHGFDAFSECVRHFYRSFFTIFSRNPRFRPIFLGSSTGFFEKYAAFGALLMYLFDFSVFFTFWSSFEALLIVLWNFVDVFLMIFQLLDEFRWFWMVLIQNLTLFWCVLLMCLGFLLCKFHDF